VQTFRGPSVCAMTLLVARLMSVLVAQVLQAAAERLLDTDEKVRIAAIEGIADAAHTGLSLLEGAGKPLTAIAERLRDVKPAVVRKAAEKLLWIFKTHAVQKDQGTMVSTGASWMQALLYCTVTEKASASMLHHGMQMRSW